MTMTAGRRRGAARWVAAGLVLALGACSRTDAPGGQAGDPSANGQAYPWSDRLDPPSADPYAGGKSYPWSGVRGGPSSLAPQGLLAGGDNFLSDTDWTSAGNGWGPVERDRSNGDKAAGDGRALTVGGQVFPKGLGVHAGSEVSYALGGMCTTFTAQVGVDDEVGDRGSVVFQLWSGQTRLYDSGVLRGSDPARSVSVNVGGVRDLRLVVTDAGDGISSDHADWGQARVSCPTQPFAGEVFLSDRMWTAAQNAWGPVERNLSNGEKGSGDGRAITLGGRVFAKGLGTHAASAVSYALGGRCNVFTASVGIDDEVGDGGSAVFQVWGDGVRLYQSPLRRGTDGALAVSVPVSGVRELKLVATDGGDGISRDHADWADARVSCAADGSAPPRAEVENLDGGPWQDWLVFSRIGSLANPPSNGVHDRATLRVRNTGSGPLTVTGLPVTGAWGIESPPSLPLTIPAGGSADVRLRFTAEANKEHSGTLTVVSNDPSRPNLVVQLRGLWQSLSENGQEPSIFQIRAAFGYTGTFTGGEPSINQDGLVRAQGDEVLSGYWQRADESQPVTVRQLAAYHTQGNTSTLFWHPKGSSGVTTILTHAGIDGQTVLPRLEGSLAPIGLRSFTPGVKTFGFKVDAEWSDPARNDQTADRNNGCPRPCGQHIRFYPIKDRAGVPIPNTYYVIMDYSGINYDYNDVNYIISNLRPAPMLINVGGPGFTDPAGNVWLPDRDGNGDAIYTPTAAIDEPTTPYTGGIAGTDNDRLYQSYRGRTADLTVPQDRRTIAFDIPVEKGTYQVKLHFAELAWNEAGRRVFDISAEGTPRITGLDIFRESGGRATALVKTLDNVQVNDGKLSLLLRASADFPSLSGIEIVR